MENRNIPVTPLPNPGEGGAVFPGNENIIPVIPLPNPGEGGPVNPGNSSGTTGGSGTTSGSGTTGGIVIQPLPGIPVPARYAAVRFLNATYGYPPFRIFVDGVRAVNLLSTGTASGYLRIPAGSRVISVRGQDGYIYLEQPLPFPTSSTSTVAIINRAGGLTLTRIADACRVI